MTDNTAQKRRAATSRASEGEGRDDEDFPDEAAHIKCEETTRHCQQRRRRQIYSQTQRHV